MEFRRFQLLRREDETGLSGTGYVAEGVKFSDGTVVIRWTTSTPTTGIYPDMATLEHLHGHQGKTGIVFLNE